MFCKNMAGITISRTYIVKRGHKLQFAWVILYRALCMDPKKFEKSAPGKLIRVEEPIKDWCFLPDELPTTWEFSPELWPLLVEAKEALGTLNGIGQTLPNPQLLLRPLQNREAISSSSIEGTFVTAQELLLFELDPSDPSSADDIKADWLEVFNYGRTLLKGIDLLKSLPLCNRLIMEMHVTLMLGVRGRDTSPGQFRRCAVQIGSSGRFVPPPWSEVERLMANLERYVNETSGDPLVRCFITHYQFEAIHPFRDGNGRVGRALLALMAQHWHGHSMPWLYLSAFFERYKDEYIETLFNVSAKGAWSEWIEFCLRATIAQANDAIRRCHQFIRLRTEYQSRINSHSARTFQIIDSLFTSPVVSIPSIASQFVVTYHTARSDIQRLVDAGILTKLATTRPKSFWAPELMKVAYGDDDAETVDDKPVG